MGIKSTKKDKDSEESVEAITNALDGGITATIKAKFGFTFFGWGGSAEAEAKSETKFGGKNKSETRALEDVTSTAESSSSVDITTTCSISATDDEIKADKTKGGVGLWQYVVSTEDMTAAAFTPHTVCRRGKLAFTPPQCPYYACKDD